MLVHSAIGAETLGLRGGGNMDRPADNSREPSLHSDPKLYVHTLQFRCPACQKQLALSFKSADRNPEKFAVTAFDLICECGWLKRALGMEAVGHYVSPCVAGKPTHAQASEIP